MQRAEGRAMAEFGVVAGRTRLARLHQAGCLKLRFPRLPNGAGDEPAEAILINSSGGLTGGDRLTQEFTVRPGARLAVTTQACERIYRASSGEARVATRIAVGEGAELSYIPQETILFDGGALSRTLDIDCAAYSRLLVAESVVLGRTLMGETVRTGCIRDRWRIRRDGRLVFAENLALDGAIEEIAGRAASLAGAKAFATILCQMPEPDLDGVRDIIGPAGGASAFDGFLVARIVETSGFALRKRLIPVLSALANAPLSRLWSM